MTGEELRALRVEKGLTQEKAAQLLGYSVGHYRRMETGRSVILERVAAFIRHRLFV